MEIAGKPLFLSVRGHELGRHPRGRPVPPARFGAYRAPGNTQRGESSDCVGSQNKPKEKQRPFQAAPHIPCDQHGIIPGEGPFPFVSATRPSAQGPRP